jgi:hypothetical protein
LIAEIRATGSSVNLRRAPVLRDFATRFLQFVDAQAVSGQLNLDTKRYYHGGWKERDWRVCASIRSAPATAAVLTFPHSPSNANRAFRTLRRMLNMAVQWKLLRAMPKIKELEELARTALIESSTEGAAS